MQVLHGQGLRQLYSGRKENMDNKQKREWEKEFYQALKGAAKSRKIKLSAQQDIYKRSDPYFYHAFYWIKTIEDHRVVISISIEVKYHRFDELQYGIIRPGDSFHFTDKIRANSTAKCYAWLPHLIQSFDWDGNYESIPRLAENLLDFLRKYISDFLEMVGREYGDLNGYYIANKEEDPRLAGLAYLDRGDHEGAIECFSKMKPGNLWWAVDIHTEEQYRRVQENGYYIYSGEDRKSFSRNQGEQFIDYAVALQNGLEWTNERAMYGLLKEEREKS